jgi:RimJ/RimL family protein N-acetyltransferase
LPRYPNAATLDPNPHEVPNDILNAAMINDVLLRGNHIHLEPLTPNHAAALAAASAPDPTLYRWSPVPQGIAAAEAYIASALAARSAGTALPFAIVRNHDNVVIGSTRFFEVEKWLWPAAHSRHNRAHPDVCEIGYTWLTQSAIRTPANTEAKTLMLAHAFETWGVLRVCLHTDARNLRSQAAIERIGGKREGVLRAHRIAADFIPRDSVRYSILADEWPEVKRRLAALAARASSL